MSHLYPSRRRPLRRRAFTLIEILIVVAILGILSAILLPVFNSARETARSATCSSNLKQLGLAINQYVQDSGGFYPHIIGLTPADGCTWSARIFPYLKSAQVLKCPSFSRGEFREGCPPSEKANDGSIYYNTWRGSYDLAVALDARNSAGMVSQVRMRYPSQRILSFDGEGYERAFDVMWPADIQNRIDEGYARHRFGLNALFFDGHVKHIPFGDIATRSYWR